MLLNLVTNAMRFTSRGSITIRAHLKQADRVEIQVQDTGAGIASDDLGKLFEEFRQVENPTNWLRREGTGLGLAIGRRFVQLHGGEMSASSEVGQGSTFWFTLPVHPPIDEMEASSTAMMDQLLQQRRLKQAEESNSLLLFLSEQPFWARVFAETLSGYQVHLLTDPNQLALQTAQLYPRALLLDQMLAQHPAVTAVDASPALRSAHHHPGAAGRCSPGYSPAAGCAALSGKTRAPPGADQRRAQPGFSGAAVAGGG